MKDVTKKYVVSWSGGKDSALALWRVWREHGPPVALITTFVDDGSRSRSHGLRPEVLDAQTASLGIPRIHIATDIKAYEQNFLAALRDLRDQQGVTAAVFGDIDLEAHRVWCRKVCDAVGIECLHPLWEEPRETLMAEFLDAGFRTRIVAVQEGKLDPALLGREIDADVLARFRDAQIDLCGENGEYHTFVTDGPCLRQPLPVRMDGSVRRDGYYFAEIALA
ncbi:diphthine--ammonia ligase [Tahibacter amnicola]|uniref:Diphthine--ammonia ligase n=1 Tax=Tahibacter amnicola TaxID=2976241 RepID=A0ABY6BC19_9GAMM|nr:diphthine--ammonia ligase [Tahibacter amnicola]UXI67102.1 diphthine--ammonia ligase [Tahibacter amnicola]